jgi:hypothetical protein
MKTIQAIFIGLLLSGSAMAAQTDGDERILTCGSWESMWSEKQRMTFVLGLMAGISTQRGGDLSAS